MSQLVIITHFTSRYSNRTPRIRAGSEQHTERGKGVRMFSTGVSTLGTQSSHSSPRSRWCCSVSTLFRIRRAFACRHTGILVCMRRPAKTDRSRTYQSSCQSYLQVKQNYCTVEHQSVSSQRFIYFRIPIIQKRDTYRILVTGILKADF